MAPRTFIDDIEKIAKENHHHEIPLDLPELIDLEETPYLNRRGLHQIQLDMLIRERASFRSTQLELEATNWSFRRNPFYEIGLPLPQRNNVALDIVGDLRQYNSRTSAQVSRDEFGLITVSSEPGVQLQNRRANYDTHQRKSTRRRRNLRNANQQHSTFNNKKHHIKSKRSTR